jgi:hypothetical protein
VREILQARLAQVDCRKPFVPKYLVFLTIDYIFKVVRKLARKPARIATIRMVAAKTATSFFLKIAASRLISRMLIPAPPIIRAATDPTPIPFAIKTALIGIIVSARMYIGIPIIAAIGMANGLSGPAILTIKSRAQNSR